MVRWCPDVTLSKREQFLIGRMTRTGKLFAFLRQHRHELFDDAFQTELEAMYRASGEGRQPVAPALLAMVLLLQAYVYVATRGDELAGWLRSEEDEFESSDKSQILRRERSEVERADRPERRERFAALPLR